MGFVLTHGHNFVDGDTVNAVNLHALIESATLTNGDRASIDRTRVSPVTYGSSAPSSPAEGELWQNSITLQILAWKSSNSTWNPVFTNLRLAQVDPSGTAVSAGEAVKATNSYISKADGGTTTQNVVGIAAFGAATGEWVIYVRHGITKALVTGAVSAGDGLRLSATAGLLESGGATLTGKTLIARALSDSAAGAAWINLRR